MDQRTGRRLEGWAHTEQSIRKLLTTRIRSRIMRLRVGADTPAMIDKPQIRETIAQIYSGIVVAVTEFEPNYEVRSLDVVDAGPGGGVAIALTGYEYPRGHLGDRTVRIRRDLTFSEFITT